jgi:hypothetical protein
MTGAVLLAKWRRSAAKQNVSTRIARFCSVQVRTPHGVFPHQKRATSPAGASLFLLWVIGSRA